MSKDMEERRGVVEWLPGVRRRTECPLSHTGGLNYAPFKQDAERLEVLGEIGGKRSSAAEAGVDAV
jgi:hypothetical protein